MIIRSFTQVDPSSVKTGIIEGRAVPYDDPIKVSDAGVVPYREYTETWKPGAFANQIKHRSNVGRVKLNYNHEPGLAAWIGRTLYLTEHDDGLYGAWQLEGPYLTQLQRAVTDGTLLGLSIGARPDEDITSKDGSSVQRLRAWLDHVALCEEPAFPNAQVLASRSKDQSPTHRISAAERLEQLRKQRPTLT